MDQLKIQMHLSDLNKACGNTMDAHEAAQMHQNFSQQLLQDHIAACSLPEHNLIRWTDGLPPVQFQPQNGPTTSLGSLLWELDATVTEKMRDGAAAADKTVKENWGVWK